ncbi:hypothetical protein CO660_05420 [Rhizobium sp. L9]|uniref:hypothetical protein n=1 Tax=Rhizobium sp. L9 TaxID=1340738 RepID=UPI000BEACF5C|nr:hypothetical protein [Rhizobium sp. L9]PDT30782.1 hypothetical protein CO660_05420 [Rhizobium sp. L9]
MKMILFIPLFAVFISGCADVLSLQGAKRYQSSVESASYDQIKMQLSKAIDDPYTVPAFANISGASLKYDSSINASPKRTFAPPGVTSEVALSVGDFSSSSTLSVTPVNSAKAVQVMRDLYANAVNGDPIRAEDLAALTIKPPRHGWLYHGRSSTPPSGCGAADLPCVALGHYGKYWLFSQGGKSYSDFALAVLQAMTLTESQSVSAAAPSGKRGGSAKPTPSGRAPSNVQKRIQSDGLITPMYVPPVILQQQ